MKTEKNIFLAFILNLAFSAFEFAGGIFTGSVAIISDALHDVGDALSIGVAFFLEKKSKKEPDGEYTYGYARYSVAGGVITTVILLCGSALVIYNSALRIITPTEINYNGMIVFAVIGSLVNLGAALLTRVGDSINQKAVNLHMLEDVLGWIVVLLGAIVMRFTNLYIIDPLMSIGVAIFILINAAKTLKEAIGVFLEKAPETIDTDEIREHICEIEGVIDIHHVHLWTMDGHHNYITLHIVSDGVSPDVKKRVREELREYGITHATLELEEVGEPCCEEHCHVTPSEHHHHHHH